MPVSALNQVKVDYFLRAKDMGPVLAQLAAGHFADEPSARNAHYEQIGLEVKIASSANAFQQGIMSVGELTPFTCPECHGVLVKLTES